jgi:hypothetical protein
VHPEDGLSNLVEFKIDKRSQIVNTANDWASFWPNRPASSMDPNPLLHATYKDSSGHELFSQCYSFAGYVYSYLGLPTAPSPITSSGSPPVTTDYPYPMVDAEDHGIKGSVLRYKGHWAIDSGMGYTIANENPYWNPTRGVTEDSYSQQADVAFAGNWFAKDPVIKNADGTPKSVLDVLDEE